MQLIGVMRESAAGAAALVPAPAAVALEPIPAQVAEPSPFGGLLSVQADFNRAVAQSLAALEESFRGLHADIGAFEERLRGESAVVGEHLDRVRENTDEIRARAEALAEESSGREKSFRAELERVSGGVGAFEERLRGEVVVIGEQLDHFREIIGDIRARMDALGEESSDREKSLRTESERVSSGVGAGAAELQRLGRLGNVLDARSAALEKTFTRELDRLRQRVTNEFAARDARIAPLQDRTGRELDEMKQRLLRAERWLWELRRPEQAAPTAAALTSERRDDTLDGPGFDYFLFEQRFRGSTEMIKRQQMAYLDLFRGRRNVADLGCGRGEFIELLTKNQIPVTGVDMDEEMVAFCCERGLPAMRADLFEHLRTQPDGGLDGIFTAQVVEHLAPARIAELLRLAGRKLAPGGIMVAETVNPNCPMAMGNFYLDPTHVRPVPALLLAFLFEQSGFKIQSLKFSSPVADSGAREFLEVPAGLPAQAALYQDYAVVAIRENATES